ncbi:MAG: hypothetical protein PHX93_05125 [Candidatus Peribacteraceae bacterium]|jgi:hypothetical protein|nr:hypothetical protein [Candidatus Peribacteraceae bacterium]
MKISYEAARAAQNDTGLRQAFLSQIDLEKARRFIAEVVYCPTTDHNHLMATNPTSRAKWGCPGERSTIEVFPNAFQLYKYEDGFKSVLIDHEGKHAEDIFENPNRIIMTARNALFICCTQRRENLREVRAIRNQLTAHALGTRNLQESHIHVLEHDLRLFLGK